MPNGTAVHILRVTEPSDAPMTDTTIPDGFQAIESRSPFAAHNGPIYQREEEDGGFVRGFHVLETHLNAGRMAHGGMLVAFADGVLGQCAGRAVGTPAVTLRLTSNFVAPARPGDWVEGRAEVIRQGRSTVFVRGQLTVRHRTVLTADGIFQPIKPAKR